MRALILLPLLLAADWPRIFGPGGDSTSAEKGLIASFPEKGPEVAWKRDVGDGYSGIVVAEKKAILFHRVGNEETIEALDAATGKRLWKHAYKTAYSDMLGKGDGPRSTPAIVGGLVFTLGPSGVLTCLSLKDGEKKWSKDIVADYDVKQAYFGVGASPLVFGKRVLVNAGGEGAGVVAFDTETGKEAWKATDQQASYATPLVAELGGKKQAVFFTRLGLLTVDEDGKPIHSRRWRPRIDASVNAASPLVLPGGHIFLSTSYNTGAILLKATKDGLEEVWKNDKSLTCHFNTPVAVGEQMFGVHGRQEEGAKLRCIEWRTGKVNWTEDGFGCGSILHADGKLWLMSESGELILAKPSADKFDAISKAKVLDGPVRATLALADGRLYCRDDKKLVCWKVAK